MSDLKAENVMVQMAADDTAQKLTIIDFGGSACYTGQSSAIWSSCPSSLHRVKPGGTLFSDTHPS